MVIKNEEKQQYTAKDLCILADKYYAKHDFDSALSCYQKATELGDKFAQYNLALMYDDGEGTEVNHVKAVYWYEKSTDLGLPEAQYNLAV